MFKKYKWQIIISSVITLLPALFGLFAEKILPEEIAVHFALDGTPDGYMNPTFFFIMMPLILIAVHLLCIGITVLINANNEQNEKVMSIIFWIMPIMSFFTCGMVFSTALGHTSNIFSSVLALLATMFIVIGNYLPKTTRNNAVGIKISWALSNDENWRATHRFGGKVYVATGVLCLFGMFLPEKYFPIFALVIILTSSLIPTVYSYVFYKKQLKRGEITKEDVQTARASLVKNPKLAAVITISVSVVLAVLFGFLMFTGDIHISLGDSAVTVEASFWGDVSIDYSDIDTVEYRENGVPGSRIYGFGTPRLSLGNFKNDEFGTYARYTYTGNKPCIVLTVGEKIIVLGTNEEQNLYELYETISEKIEK